MNARQVQLVAPLTALLAFALLVLVLAAHAGIAFCANRIAIVVPEMPGMTMDQPLMICPVMLVLIIASTLLAAGAIALSYRDPHRGLTRRSIVGLLARLPLAAAAGVVSGLAVAALALMTALDGTGVPDAPTCALSVAFTVGGALVAVGAATLAARLLRAFAERLIVAIVAAIGDRHERERVSGSDFVPCEVAREATRLLAAVRGLRAPPSFVR